DRAEWLARRTRRSGRQRPHDRRRRRLRGRDRTRRRGCDPRASTASGRPPVSQYGDRSRQSPAVRLLSARPRLRFAGWAISIGLALAIVGFAAAAQWKGSVARQDYTSSAQQVLAAQVLALEQEQKTLRDQLADGESQVQTFQNAS